MFQESILLDQEQDKALTKTDAIITGAGYNDTSYDTDEEDDDPYSAYDAPAPQRTQTMSEDRVDFDSGIPAGIRELPRG